MNIVRKNQAAQPSSLLTKESLRGILEKRNDCTVDAVLLFVVASTDRSLGFV